MGKAKGMTLQEYKKQALRSKKFREEYEKFDIGLEIYLLRSMRKLSQTQLAVKAKTKQGSISRIESGTISPSIRTILKILKALDAKMKITFELI